MFVFISPCSCVKCFQFFALPQSNHHHHVCYDGPLGYIFDFQFLKGDVDNELILTLKSWLPKSFWHTFPIMRIIQSRIGKAPVKSQIYWPFLTHDLHPIHIAAMIIEGPLQFIQRSYHIDFVPTLSQCFNVSPTRLTSNSIWANQLHEPMQYALLFCIFILKITTLILIIIITIQSWI